MTILFYIAGAIAIIASIAVILQTNIVHALLYMVVSLLSVAVVFYVLGAPFAAMLEAIVYAGAIMVLFLFVIMLLNLGHDYKRDIRGGLAILFGFGVTGGIGGLLASRVMPEGTALLTSYPPEVSIDTEIAEKGIIGIIAEPLFNEYLVAFEFTGVLLFVAIVGALALAKRSD